MDEEATEAPAKVAAFPIIDSSPLALAKCAPDQVGKGLVEPMRANAKYPIAQLKVGQSFSVPIESLEIGSLSSLRSLASQHTKRSGKKFAVLTHKQWACIEVARIA